MTSADKIIHYGFIAFFGLVALAHIAAIVAVAAGA